MKYDFDNLADRTGVNSLKYSTPNVLPMWVADMDFKTPDFIMDAIKKRVEKGAFGYTNDPDYYYEAIINFWQRRHNLTLERKDIAFTTGVVPAISSTVRCFTEVGDNVIILSPVYNIFYNSIRNNKRVILSCDLIYKDNKYSVDYDDLEKKLSDEKTKLMIFCNPHNPIGYIWNKEELAHIARLCKKHNVIILSDEIHCDIINPGLSYTPFLSIDEAKDITIMAGSASKCFNLAGLQGAFVASYNEDLYKRIYRALNNDEVAEGNAFVYDALTAAFNNGDEWLKEMNEYVYKNKLYVKEFINNNIKRIKYVENYATYLIWVDVKDITNNVKKFTQKLKEKYGLWVSSGDSYGDNGEGFIRINLATSFDNVVTCMNKLKQAVDEL